MKIFELFGEVKLDGLDTAEKGMDKLDKKGGGVAKVLGGIGKAALIGGAAVGGAAVAMLKMADNAAKATDQIDKGSQKLGFTREAYQEWDYILSQNGASIEGLGAGMKTLTNQVDELGKGGKIATDAFSELGLSYDELEGKSQEEIFEITIEALQGVEDETKRAALANDLLGRSGQELAPLLNAGAESVKNLTQQAHDMGIVMGDEAIDAGVLFTDTMDTLKRSFSNVAAEVGVAVMPIMQQLAEWVIANMPTIRNVFSTVFGVISTVVTAVVDTFTTYMLPILKTIFEWVKLNMPTIQLVFKTAFDTMKTVTDTLWRFITDNLVPIFKTLFGFVQDNFPTIQRIFENVFGLASEVVQTLWDVFTGLWEFIEPTFPLIGAIIETAFGIVTDTVEDVIETFRTLVGWIRSAVEWLEKFDRKKINDSGTFGNLSGDLGQFIDGARADGGPVNAGGTYLVGERGPELFTPGTNGNIIPNGGSPITVQTMVVREEADIKKVARELYNMQVATSRGGGF